MNLLTLSWRNLTFRPLSMALSVILFALGVGLISILLLFKISSKRTFQKTWPALIMGASRMWLDLVGELADAHADEADLERRYEIVQQDLNNIWAGQGQHAMLHHLSAIFAYQPLLIKY